MTPREVKPGRLPVRRDTSPTRTINEQNQKTLLDGKDTLGHSWGRSQRPRSLLPASLRIFSFDWMGLAVCRLLFFLPSRFKGICLRAPFLYSGIFCPDPGVSAKGNKLAVLANEVYEGRCCPRETLMVFECHEGYDLIGEQILKCGADSLWSSPRPLCKRELRSQALFWT